MRYWDGQTIDKIRKGYFSAVYFNRTKHILEQEKNYKRVTMQFFQKNKGSILCGVDEVVELLKVGTGYWDPPQPRLRRAKWVSKFSELEVRALSDGDKISAWETVMHITGPYVYFAHLESLYLGILARRTLVATNTRKAVNAAKGKPFGKAQGKPVIFFADRFDHFLNQEGDGYAAYVGGASAICTAAMGKWWGGSPAGTIPHSLIAINNGDTVSATKQFAKYYKNENVIALVDFDNDCVKTSLEVARVLKDKLWGVRLDTAENLKDKSLRNFKFQISNFKLLGVNPTLVKNVRAALDKEGFKHVKIIVSGGFNEKKIKCFEKEKAPVDMYGVGSALVHGGNDFTADVVKVEEKPVAKVGRKFQPNSRLQLVKLV